MRTEGRIICHLGSVRLAYRPGISTLAYDYDAWGVELGSGPGRKGYIDKERDRESGTHNHGVRQYEPSVEGRFLSGDALWERYRAWSPYTYALNNPHGFIDQSGDSAWAITNSWNAQYIDAYREFAVRRGYIIKNVSKIEYSCEDFALALLIRFARFSGLPLSIKTASGTFDAASDEFDNAEDFSEALMSAAGAGDLNRRENTVPVSSASEARPGDIILSRFINRVAHHTQVVVGNDGTNVKILQGNTDRSWTKLNSGNPNSIFYVGKPIESATWNLATDRYVNHTTGSVVKKYTKSYKPQVVQWNFYGWNK